MCQGLVLEVCENRSKPIVSVKWNAMPDVDGYDESSVLNVVLLPSKWKKDVAMSWKMDVDAGGDEGEESESKSEVDTESEEGSKEESEKEEEISDNLEVG